MKYDQKNETYLLYTTLKTSQSKKAAPVVYMHSIKYSALRIHSEPNANTP